MKKISCHVLVIGGGGAGLRAALAAKEENPDLKVTLATKGILGKSGVTAVACSDRMAFHAALPHTEPIGAESWKYHARDIYEIGGKVSDGHLAEILAKNAEDAFNYLDKLGVPFVKKGGIPDQFITDGSEYARACYTGPKTAVHIEEALVREIKNQAVQVIEHCMIDRIIVREGRVIGAVGIDATHNNLEEALLVFDTENIILATGGAGEAYSYNVFPKGATGDAYALAYEAGAELVNMEFIQIGIASTKTKLNCSGSAMRAIPRFINDKGEEFLPAYFPKGIPLTEIYDCVFQKGASWPVTFEHKTHVIDIAVYKEMCKGRRVFLDYAKNPQDFEFSKLSPRWQERYRTEMSLDLGDELRQLTPLNRLKEINPATIMWLKERGIDLEAGDQVEIATCIQHFQGGVKIGAKGETKITGLYAVGECAGGQHGANRPGGNALLDCQVFGKIAGIDAARRCVQHYPGGEKHREEINRVVDDFICFVKELEANREGHPAELVKEKLQELMHASASVVRTETGLTKALKKLGLLQNLPLAVDENGYDYALETKNLLIVAQMILQAAKIRRESRGPHLFFENFADNTPIPRKDPQWQKYIIISKKEDGMEIKIKKPPGLS
ncbi:MAG: FAD-binding protein [Bacillota bacterium]